MVLTTVLKAQDPGQVQAYFEQHPEEKLFVHVARPYVLTGETLRFRIFHIMSATRVPETFSAVAYVELLDPENKPISQVRIRMDSSGGNGFIDIPPEVNSGKYILRAYTQWMRNDDPSRYFHTTVQVINTFKRLGLQSPGDDVVVSVFPEGGNFVYGLRSRAGLQFRTVGGAPVVADFSLLQGDSVLSHGRPDAFGLADVYFTPHRINELAVAVLGDTLELQGPEPLDEGVVMEVQTKADEYEVAVSTSGSDEEYILAILSNGRFNYRSEKRSVDGEAIFHIPELSTGVSQVTVFSRDGTPLTERLIYRKPAEIDVRIRTDQEAYDPRDQMEIEIDLAETDHDGKNDLSVSIYYWDPLIDESHIDIGAYFNLTSDLRGVISLPADYLDEQENIERLLLTYGWRRYDWSRIKSLEDPQFLPEFRQPVIRGQTSVGNVSMYASVPESFEKLFIAGSDADGRFSFELPNVNDNTRMIIQSRVAAEISIDDPFDSRRVSMNVPPFDLSENLYKTLQEANVNLQVNKYFSPEPVDKKDSGQPFYGEPDASYMLDDYTRFPVMEEVLREYIYGVYVRKRDGNYYLRVLDEGGEESFTKEPLIILDGVPVFDTDALMDIDPLLIERIDVVRRKYGYGPNISEGIVALYSYESDLANFVLPSEAIDLNYRAAQRYKEFYVPTHTPGERLPDFRNQVYWNPRLILDESGPAKIRFSLPDNPGLFRIEVQGMDGKGSFGSSVRTFRIE